MEALSPGMELVILEQKGGNYFDTFLNCYENITEMKIWVQGDSV
jgi:hypothetical protein